MHATKLNALAIKILPFLSLSSFASHSDFFVGKLPFGEIQINLHRLKDFFLLVKFQQNL
jgi:hypothetical protein